MFFFFKSKFLLCVAKVVFTCPSSPHFAAFHEHATAFCLHTTVSLCVRHRQRQLWVVFRVALKHRCDHTLLCLSYGVMKIWHSHIPGDLKTLLPSFMKIYVHSQLEQEGFSLRDTHRGQKLDSTAFLDLHRICVHSEKSKRSPILTFKSELQYLP